MDGEEVDCGAISQETNSASNGGPGCTCRLVRGELPGLELQAQRKGSALSCSHAGNATVPRGTGHTCFAFSIVANTEGAFVKYSR